MDGGHSLLMKGDGKKGFTPLWPNESGVAIPYASYSAGTADFDRDGDLDLVVGTNNDRVRLLKNNAAKQDSVRIVIDSESGIQFPAGTSFVLKGKDFQRKHEVRAGGGYLSQSFAEVIIGAEVAKRTEEIEVHWPDGKTTTHEFKPADGVLVIQSNK